MASHAIFENFGENFPLLWEVAGAHVLSAFSRNRAAKNRVRDRPGFLIALPCTGQDLPPTTRSFRRRSAGVAA